MLIHKESLGLTFFKRKVYIGPFTFILVNSIKKENLSVLLSGNTLFNISRNYNLELHEKLLLEFAKRKYGPYYNDDNILEDYDTSNILYSSKFVLKDNKTSEAVSSYEYVDELRDIVKVDYYEPGIPPAPNQHSAGPPAKCFELVDSPYDFYQKYSYEFKEYEQDCQGNITYGIPLLHNFCLFQIANVPCGQTPPPPPPPPTLDTSSRFFYPNFPKYAKNLPKAEEVNSFKMYKDVFMYFNSQIMLKNTSETNTKREVEHTKHSYYNNKLPKYILDRTNRLVNESNYENLSLNDSLYQLNNYFYPNIKLNKKYNSYSEYNVEYPFFDKDLFVYLREDGYNFDKEDLNIGISDYIGCGGFDCTTYNMPSPNNYQLYYFNDIYKLHSIKKIVTDHEGVNRVLITSSFYPEANNIFDTYLNEEKLKKLLHKISTIFVDFKGNLNSLVGQENVTGVTERGNGKIDKTIGNYSTFAGDLELKLVNNTKSYVITVDFKPQAIFSQIMYIDFIKIKTGTPGGNVTPPAPQQPIDIEPFSNTSWPLIVWNDKNFMPPQYYPENEEYSKYTIKYNNYFDNFKHIYLTEAIPNKYVKIFKNNEVVEIPDNEEPTYKYAPEWDIEEDEDPPPVINYQLTYGRIDYPILFNYTDNPISLVNLNIKNNSGIDINDVVTQSMLMEYDLTVEEIEKYYSEIDDRPFEEFFTYFERNKPLNHTKNSPSLEVIYTTRLGDLRNYYKTNKGKTGNKFYTKYSYYKKDTSSKDIDIFNYRDELDPTRFNLRSNDFINNSLFGNIENILLTKSLFEYCFYVIKYNPDGKIIRQTTLYRNSYYVSEFNSTVFCNPIKYDYDTYYPEIVLDSHEGLFLGIYVDNKKKVGILKTGTPAPDPNPPQEADNPSLINPVPSFQLYYDLLVPYKLNFRTGFEKSY